MLLMSTSGVLGRYVPLAPTPAIWWRCALAAAFLVAYARYRRLDLRLPRGRSRAVVALAGVLLAAHWVTYFYALKLAGVAVGMLALFTYPAMTSLLEPLLLGGRVERRHLALGLLVVLGVDLLAPGRIDLADDAFVGLLFGLGSALIYALRNIAVKTQVDRIDGTVLMGYQVLATVVVLSPVFAFEPFVPTAAAMPFLLGLGLVTTAVGHTMFVHTFRHFSVSAASLLSCVQPVYGILLAIAAFGEWPRGTSVLGGALILAAVAVESRQQVR